MKNDYSITKNIKELIDTAKKYKEDQCSESVDNSKIQINNPTITGVVNIDVKIYKNR